MDFIKNKKFTFIFMLFLVIIFSDKYAFADWSMVGENKYQYINPSTGQPVTNNWIQTNNGYYFMDTAGIMTTGWFHINGKWYYFGHDGLMRVGYQTIDGKKYYFHPSEGYMVTGWIQENNNNVVDYHYFDLATGEEVEGWLHINDKWYYFYDYNCLMNVWAQINNSWYHFNRDGSMTTGWYEQEGMFYFLNMATGAMVTGWIQDEYGYRYYLNETNGTLAVNTTVMINGFYYAFDAYGRLVENNNAGDASTYNYQGGPSIIYGNVAQGASTNNISIGISPLDGVASMGNANSSINQQMQTYTPIQPGTTQGPS